MASDSVETEAKLGAWPGFELPIVDGVVPGLRAEAGEPRTLDATYVDAPDLRLIRAGISLRHRAGEGGPDGLWTLKLPNDADVGDGVLRRRELTVPGSNGPVPTELAVLVRPWLRTASLGVVAHLQTVRRTATLVVDPEAGGADEADGGGPVPVGSVDDDEVSVLQEGRVGARFREVEVEVVEGAPDGLLDAVVAVLRDAGAGAPDPTPKLVRALGPRALQPSDLARIDVADDASAAEVLRAGIAASVLRIVEHDAVIRADEEPEGIHQARVGMRRLRSDLKTFAPLLDTAWSEPLREELRWVAGELGEVRDRDVLGARLRDQLAVLPEPERAAAAAVLVRLAKERQRALTKAVSTLDSRRYLALLDRLVAAVNEPRTLPAADAPGKDVLPGLAADAFHTLRKGARKLGKHPADEALHEARIKAKKARYAADVAVPVVGDAVKAYTKAMGALQDVLGDHHDCAVAEAWLTEATRAATRGQAFALGQLVAHQRHEADRLRGEWRAAWEAVDRKKLTAWMSG